MIIDWQRSDVIATVALVVAIAAAAFTGWQTFIARRKEKREIADATPAADIIVSLAAPAGTHDVTVWFANRSNEILSDVRITIEKPAGVVFVIYPDSDYIVNAANAARRPCAVLSDYVTPQRETRANLHIDTSGRAGPFKAKFVIAYVSRGSRERSSKIILRRTIP